MLQLANKALVTYSSPMIGFFIKKAFFDGWDNLISMVLFNLMYVALLMLCLYAVSAIPSSAVLFITIFAGVFIFSLLMGGTAAAALGWSDYRSGSWASFRQGIGRNIRHSLLFCLILLLFIFNIVLIIPFYVQSIGGVPGFIISLILFWMEIAIALTLPFYFPLMNLLPADRPLKTLKKCFIILLDNLGFSIFFFIYNLILVAVSVFTIGLVPGMTGLQLLAQDGMKLVMMKYDWLDANPGADRRHLPWADILFEEKEKVGPRSLKSMIFPWK